MNPGDWGFSLDHGETCRVLSCASLWGKSTALVWLPARAVIERVSSERLVPVEQASPLSPWGLAHICAAARLREGVETEALVAPIGASVLPLPHQLYALQRAVAGESVRVLLADEVGLGKTIEAGLILRELKARGVIRRVLVVVPAGLVQQWASEMRVHFQEEFRVVVPAHFAAWRQALGIEERENLWQLHDQVICPLDSVKPVDGRRGWSRGQLERYNRERFEDLLAADWDLVIFDEAHRLAGSTAEVARYRLGESLARSAPHLLLLSATPHQGKTDSFRRLLGLLDPALLPGDEAVRRDLVEPFVIRTEKRQAIDSEGRPLFHPRFTQLEAVAWEEEKREQRALYEAVTSYVREGYNQAQREKRTAVGFLMILFQRLVTSSTAAIRTALERRLEALEVPTGQLGLFGEDVGEEWLALDPEEQLERLVPERLKGLKNERAEVELLLSAARRCEARGPDVKAVALLSRILQLQREESDPEVKVLVFTEFIPTQKMLVEFLSARGFRPVSLNGAMDLGEREEAQQAFAGEAQVLVSTDAGGEGLNLQFAHVVVNYDLPWNPMKLEQRIGRVDRIGQSKVVRAFNFALQGTVELRVRQVLEEKLGRILAEFGVDKLGDVLDSEAAGMVFEEIYVQAIANPEGVEGEVSRVAEEVRESVVEARSGSTALPVTRKLDPGPAKRVAEQPVSYWIEQMTVGFLRSHEEQGAFAHSGPEGYHLRWPDGWEVRRAAFDPEEARRSGARLISLDLPRVRGVAAHMPYFGPGQPIPVASLQGFPAGVRGDWSLWRIALSSGEWHWERFLAILLTDEGRALLPAARAVWDRLLSAEPGMLLGAEPAPSADAGGRYSRSRNAAEDAGRPIFEELEGRLRRLLRQERARRTLAFAGQRRAIERVGLEAVRAHRMRRLEQEERDWAEGLAARERAQPELDALAMVRIEGAGRMESAVERTP